MTHVNEGQDPRSPHIEFEVTEERIDDYAMNLERRLSSKTLKKDLFGRAIDFVRNEFKKYCLIKKFKAEYSMVLDSGLPKRDIDFLLKEGYIVPNGACFVPLHLHGKSIQHYSPTNKGWNRFTKYGRISLENIKAA